MIAADFLTHRKQAYSKVSPGNELIPSRLYLPDLHPYIPYEFRALEMVDSLPYIDASYQVPVRQVNALPSASFTQHLTIGVLAARLVLPLIGRTEDLKKKKNSPPSISALPGAQQKKHKTLRFVQK